MTKEYCNFPDIARRNLFQKWLEIPAMSMLLRLPKHQRVLEVGCGRGVGLTELGKWLRPSRLVGLDISETFLNTARERLRRDSIEAELVHADVRTIPFEDASFDLIIDFGTCYHIASPERGLSEIARVLAPGRWFVHETPLSQLLSHPVRSFGKFLPWNSAPELKPYRFNMLWSMRYKVS